MSQQLDFLMSSMRSKIQNAVSEMQAQLQEELQEEELKIYHVLGQGAFGTVYHGALVSCMATGGITCMPHVAAPPFTLVTHSERVHVAGRPLCGARCQTHQHTAMFQNALLPFDQQFCSTCSEAASHMLNPLQCT